MTHSPTCAHDPCAHEDHDGAFDDAGWDQDDERWDQVVAARTAHQAPTVPTVSGSRLRSGALALAEVRWAALATVLFVLAVAAQLSDAPVGLAGVAFTGCFASGGWVPARDGLMALKARHLDVDLLMIVAALGAAAIGQVLDGALLIVIFATSGALEAAATQRTGASVRALLTLAPERANRLSPLGDEECVATASLDVGDLVVVRPGERVGADGEVIDGASEVDEASITGEAFLATKEPGDEVFAGTLNGTGVLRVRVGRPAAESVVARIVAMVERASATKATTQLFIARLEQRYSVGVVVATVALFAVPLAFGAALQPTLLRAMTFMIVASPCALVLATMPPLLSAVANAGRHGVLVKSAVVMERLAGIDMVCFDKTGTLTEGTPRVTAVRALDGSGLDDDDLLSLVASAERPSEHPLGRAVVAAAGERGLHLHHAEQFRAWPGRGVSATVAGRFVEVGRSSGLRGGPLDVGPLAGLVDELRQAGDTVVVVRVDGQSVGVLALADHPRRSAAMAVEELARQTGATPVLLTGDAVDAASRLAAEVGISEVHAGLLPDEKVAVVHRLQADGARVLVVGDGVNDAPALAAADVGAALRGSDLALETADLVVVGDDLATLPQVIALSRRAHRVMVQNLAVAGSAIVVLVTLDLLGKLPLPLGVAGHEGSTILVALNGLRLLRRKAWLAVPFWTHSRIGGSLDPSERRTSRAAVHHQETARQERGPT